MAVSETKNRERIRCSRKNFFTGGQQHRPARTEIPGHRGQLHQQASCIRTLLRISRASSLADEASILSKTYYVNRQIEIFYPPGSPVLSGASV